MPSIDFRKNLRFISRLLRILGVRRKVRQAAPD
jgi:hypothetical protein